MANEAHDSDLELGWYHIDAVWNLYQDEETDGEVKRVLTQVHVDYICVDESAEGSNAPLHVDHYDRGGGLITSLKLDEDDIKPELRDRETTDRPLHI